MAEEEGIAAVDPEETMVDVPIVLVIARPYDAEMIRVGLADAGFLVQISNGRDDPARRAAELDPRCVVLSLRLAGVRPREVLAALRAAVGPQLPIVLVKGRSTDELTLADAVSMGATQLAGRPLDPVELVAKVQGVLPKDSDPQLQTPAESVDDSSDSEDEELSEFEDTPELSAGTGPWQPGQGPGRHRGDTLPRWNWSTKALGEPEVEESEETEETEEAPQELAPVGIIAVDLPLSGDLGTVALPVLLDRIRRAGFSGVLTSRRDEATKEIHFDDGYPVMAASSEEADQIGQMLLREGKLSRDQFETCQREHQEERGLQMGAVLVERGLLKQEELYPIVRRHVAEIIYSLFSWAAGKYELTPRQTPPSERVCLDPHPRALVLEGIRRKYGLDRLLELVTQPSMKPRVSETASRLDQAELSELEQQAVTLLDGSRTLQEVLDEGPLDQLRLYQLVYGLSTLGLIDAEAEGGATPAPRGHSELTIDRQRVIRKHAQVCQSDYFTLLGLSPDASGHEVERACDEMAATFDSSRIPAEIADEFAEQLIEISEVVEEARRILGDDGLRRAYRETLR